MGRTLTRRSFVKWGTATAGAVSLVGFTGCSSGSGGQADTDAKTGEWLSAPCWNNCGGTTRCLNKVYVEDGVPLKMRSDESDEDSYANPQRRSCLRGRAKISEVFSPARIKYPMKRKSFSFDDPHGELRGIDEWERISWDEALDLVAEGIQRALDQYGPKGILCGASSNFNVDGFFDQNVNLLNVLGGSVHAEAGTVSGGSWPVLNTHMVGGSFAAPHRLQLLQSDLHVLFGCNWAANHHGVYSLWFDECRKRGAKVIIIDPWLNQTASAIADEWVPVLPGTDTALIAAIAYEWIKAGTFDQEFLDKYCIGFDGDHMPEGAPENASWKDYILGTGYDMTEKTPEWAEAICGVPADTIRSLAAEIASVDKVNFFAGLSTSKIPAGEQLCQSFITLALMHGGYGQPGHYFQYGTATAESAGPAISAGAFCPVTADPANPLQPDGAPIYMGYPIPNFEKLGDAEWLNLEPAELWRTILAGEYGRDCWPGGKIKVDIHAAYFGGYMSTLNQVPDTMNGIKVVRGLDFVYGINPFFDSTRQYCDVLLPCPTYWEKQGRAANLNDGTTIPWFAQIFEPMYEAKPESWIADELAKRLGVDPKEVSPMNDSERTYATVRDAVLVESAGADPVPLLSITQEEIAEFFPEAEGEPQDGLYTFAEFREKGILKAPITEDTDVPEPLAAFIADPEANPLTTESGKFEIYCQSVAKAINAVGYSEIYPVGVYQLGDSEQGAGNQTDEYPLLLWTPHTLRRAHSVNDNVLSLREAFPQACYMSKVDADVRGIANGDTVLMTSPHGKVLRRAKVMTTIVPGAVAMEDGAWFEIDEETGIDLGGCPNVLQAPRSSGGGCQAWTGTLLQVEKYEGPLELPSDKNRPVVTPVGIVEE